MGQSYLKNAALLTGADVLLRLAGMGLRKTPSARGCRGGCPAATAGSRGGHPPDG